MKILCFAILLSLSCCKDKITVQDITLEDSSFNNADAPESSTLKNKNQNQLMGLWTEGSTENVTFAIVNDSIFYVDNNVSVPYYLSGNSIKIVFPTYTYNALIAFEKDTLFLVDTNGDSKYWRFKIR